MNPTEPSLPYITGMGYRNKCDFIFDEFHQFGIDKIEQKEGMKIFVKTDFLFDFIKYFLPKIRTSYFLFTHNSDLPITSIYSKILEDQKLLLWYGQNVCYTHSKLKSIPIGIANKRWEHGNTEILEKVINENNKKENLVYCCFDIKTNLSERNYCLDQIFPVKNLDKVDFESHLKNISKSYFVISPNGNGVDCHKHWESLYLKAVPIVTSSINISFYEDYPFLIIDDWSDYKKINLSESLYYEIWNNFDSKKLFI